ncbi:MAG: transglycosylase domain-containing protein, partial [Elusimicrobia bacterium]|nr:transglycosylase domain-containing protein [Elusimicrobiota bacterium]
MSKGRRRKSRPRGAIALAAIVAASAGALIICALIIHAERKLSTLVLGGLGEAFPTKIYSAPLIIQEGSFISPHRLMRRLDRLGYQTVPAPEHPGEFSWQDPVFTIYLRGFDLPHIKEKPRLVSLDLGDQNQWRLHESNDGEAFQVALDPLLLTDVSGAEKIRRDPAEWRDFPQYLIRAVISAEDKRFFDHWGVDPKALLRASWRNIKNPGHLQGGSTITQQLAKNLLLTPKRTLWRKLAEAALSVYLELRLSKEEILTLYLNHIYLGQDGATSVTGVKAAAELYFGKPLPALTTSEAALLAGLIRSPYRYNPFRDPEESLKRRRHILRLMRQNGYLTGGQERLHDQEPLRLRQA